MEKDQQHLDEKIVARKWSKDTSGTERNWEIMDTDATSLARKKDLIRSEATNSQPPVLKQDIPTGKDVKQPSWHPARALTSLQPGLQISFDEGYPRVSRVRLPPSSSEHQNAFSFIEEAPPIRELEDFKELGLRERKPFAKSASMEELTIAIPNGVDVSRIINDPVKEARFEVVLPTALMAETLRHVELVKNTLRQLFPSLPPESCFELGVVYDCVSGESEDDNLNSIPGTQETQSVVCFLG
jgi:hypothetical protein